MGASKNKTLRDEFALACEGFSDTITAAYAATLAGVRAPTEKQAKSVKFMAAFWPRAEAAFRYRFADAMIAARSKK